jgi:hypothetical protein
MHKRYLLYFLAVILATRYCSAEACHFFQDMHHPGLIDSNTPDYCQRNQSIGCCTMTSVLNYEEFISRGGIEVLNSGIKTGSKCQQMSRELACHYGCSPHISIEFDANTLYFHPQFNFDFILKFTTECSNSMWCGTWNIPNRNRPRDFGCYSIHRGRIVYNAKNHLSSKLLSATEFAKQVLDARFATYSGTINPHLIIINSEPQVEHSILFEIISALVKIVWTLVSILGCLAIFLLLTAMHSGEY